MPDSGDIYGLSFEVIDEERYQAVTSLDQVDFRELEEVEPTKVVTDEQEHLGAIALTEVTLDAGIEEEVVEAIEVQSDDRETLTSLEPSLSSTTPDLHPELMSLASATIDTVLRQTTKKIIPVGEFCSVGFNGERVERDVYRELVNAINADGRVIHVGGGDYRLTDSTAGASGQEESDISPTQISWLAYETVSTLLSGGLQQVGQKRLMGALKSTGVFLSSAELNEFFARVASDQRVIPQPDGSFRLNSTGTHVSGESNAGTPTTSDTLSNSERTREQKREAQAERMRLYDSGKKAKANPRIRGRNFRRKGSRMQGRSHGKTKTIEQLLADMDKPETDR